MTTPPRPTPPLPSQPPSSALLSATGLCKRYPNGVAAVDDVSLYLRKGEILGLVGESGSGKSTTAKMILRLLRPDAGQVIFAGRDLATVRGAELRALRARLQLVPQSPQTSLNPRLTIGQAIAFNLRAHGCPRAAVPARVAALLDRVGVPPGDAGRYPHEMSGGQVQRVALARALSTDPELIVCDEAVSALDKSIQAQVLNLLAALQRDTGVAVLFISHDLAVVEHIADRVAVMRHGRVVEEGDVHQVWTAPHDPYTRELLSSIPPLG
ncbi:hypothetical protein GCM10022224_009140 [Nonomuraea antimicrobica]|uniref:Glutathione import ATP-binding protein GsiA n=1 Tax=Nonomuraea antimicrobica TaxID=561173 RepID=A0ABP7B5C2_9ACTN